MNKEKLLTWVFTLYVIVLAIGTVDQVFLDSMIFPPALDRQILGMVDVLRERKPAGAAEARDMADHVRERLAGIRLDPKPSPVEEKLAAFVREGASAEEGTKLLEEARQQAVSELVDNDEFSLAICIRALDPDLVMKLWVPGLSSDDLRVKEGCLEALKKISGRQDGFGYDPRGSVEAQRAAIAEWKRWYDLFMDERRRPVQPAPAAPTPPQPPAGAPAAPAPAPSAP